jgi:hypothetical protein
MKRPRDEKQLAKEIVAEIVRQFGGVISERGPVDKAFYHAHLIYAEAEPGYLSNWPVVKLQHGAGIADLEALLAEMVRDGVLEPIAGGHRAFASSAAETDSQQAPLEPPAIKAISDAVRLVAAENTASFRTVPCVYSRSWREAEDGDELNFYCDDVPEQEYQERSAAMRKMVEAMYAAWNDSMRLT